MTEIAREVNRGKPLSEQVKVAMQQDLQMAQEQPRQGDGHLMEVALGKPSRVVEARR